MKKLFILTLISSAFIFSNDFNFTMGGRYNADFCKPVINPTIKNNSGCTCNFSQCYLGGMDRLNSNYVYLKCSCPGFRATTALPTSFVKNGLSLGNNNGKLQITSPKEITVCVGYDGCGGYCAVDAKGNPQCAWGSIAPQSWMANKRR